MATCQINVQRFNVVSSRAFSKVLGALEAALGHPEMKTFLRDLAAAKTEAELTRIVNAAAGPSGLMEFARFDLGEVRSKESGKGERNVLRLLVGNPLVMKGMVKHVPDAGSYAPVTILVNHRSDGVHIFYHRMTSFPAPYGSPEASKVAQELDAKVEALLTSAAS